MSEPNLSDLNRMLESVDDATLQEFGAKLQEELDLRKARPLNKLELFITHRCNLRCDYCFLDGSPRQGDMPMEIAERALQLLMRRSKSAEHLVLTLFGGEPLMNMDRMEEILQMSTRMAAENGKYFTYTCTTNGLLLDERAMEIREKYGFNYLLSIDGNRENHDRHRRTVSGEGTYDDLLERIQFLKPRQGWLGARMTVTPESLPTMAQSVRELFDIGINQFLIEFLHDNSWQPDQLAQIKDQYHQLLDFYLATLKQGLLIRIGEAEHGNLRNKHTGVWGCPAGTGSISVTADGSIYPCSRVIRHASLCMGNMMEGDIIWEMGKPFSDMRREIRWKCMKCELTDFCVGGCPAANAEATGTPYYPPEVCCAVVRALGDLETEHPEFAPLLSSGELLDAVGSEEQSPSVSAPV